MALWFFVCNLGKNYGTLHFDTKSTGISTNTKTLNFRWSQKLSHHKFLWLYIMCGTLILFDLESFVLFSCNRFYFKVLIFFSNTYTLSNVLSLYESTGFHLQNNIWRKINCLVTTTEFCSTHTLTMGEVLKMIIFHFYTEVSPAMYFSDYHL